MCKGNSSRQFRVFAYRSYTLQRGMKPRNDSCFYALQSSAPAELIWNYVFPVHARLVLAPRLFKNLVFLRKRLFTINDSLVHC